MQCLESQRVSYKRAVTNVLPLDIPLEAATNKAELADYQVGPSEVQSEWNDACCRLQGFPQPHAPRVLFSGCPTSLAIWQCGSGAAVLTCSVDLPCNELCR